MVPHSGMVWAVRVIAPWQLGVGLLVSFTAVAGQEPGRQTMVSDQWAVIRSPTNDRRSLTMSDGDLGFSGRGSARTQIAHLTIGAPEDLRPFRDEREPNDDLKPNVERFPEVDRTHRGDPVVLMRPGFDTRLPTPGGVGAADAADPELRVDGAATIVARASRADMSGDATSREPADPGQDGGPTTQRSRAEASPAQGASATTAVANEAMRERAAHGATPQVARAVALSSSTPAQPDAIPIEVAAFPHATIALAPGGRAGPGEPASPEQSERPDYASLIDQDKLDREKRCLAEAVYFEARGESEQGRAAVAQVVLNRVSSGLYPASVCGVVYQNRRHHHRCQFSFACEGRPLRVTERDAWASAVRIANEVMNGRTYISDVGPSTHYHANYVKPRWAKQLKKTDVIGHHVFYRLKPGQT